MYETVLTLIGARLQDNWDEVAIPVAWDGVEYEPVRGQSFIRLVVTQTESVLTTAASPGKGNYREHGLITVQVFTEWTQGAVVNANVADMVTDLFRGYTVDRLFCQEARINRIGQREEWYQANVLIDFYYDNCLNA